MGTFYVGCKIDNHINREKTTKVSRLLVDTGSEFTWNLSKKSISQERQII
ncbi:MAG: hypothetical protein SCARUB_02722 [Candidatus Scalindua rubra]|uniref:Uncharacterized protein n=1 Tax=Candidatus Scalindua rubra TaxID=1872076 RepID=A0A1E3X957_9BACT|nr:MAG: hypothetical protein SCARUB_02722 [Candidatus Scalindua rubra]